MKLLGKVALVTGGARGLGKGFAELLLQKGARVSVLDVLKQDGEETLTEFQEHFGHRASIFSHCDITDTKCVDESIQETVKKLGGLDILVNNAGVGDEDNWSKMIDINLKGAIHASYEAMKYMNKETGGKGGLIVNISSAAGLYPSPLLSSYSASKHGLVGFTKSLGMTLDTLMPKCGIRVSCMCPHFVDTEMVHHMKEVLYERGMEDIYNHIYEDGAVMKIPYVVDAFEQLLKDDHAQGAVFLVDAEKKNYVYPKSKIG